MTIRLCKFFAVAALVGIAQGGAAQTLPVTRLAIGMYQIQAEVAATEQARERGLMYRKSLEPQEGMLFVFDVAQDYCFWMKNTEIPLSIAFIDRNGEIVNIDEMLPQTETNHCAVKPITYALEMNKGWFSRKGIKAGMKISGLDAGKR